MHCMLEAKHYGMIGKNRSHADKNCQKSVNQIRDYVSLFNQVIMLCDIQIRQMPGVKLCLGEFCKQS